MTERYVAGAVFQATAFDDKGTNFNVCLDSSRAFEHGSTAQIFLGRTDGVPPGTPPLVALKVFSQNVEEQELHKLQAQNRELKHAKEFRHANILPYCGTAVFDMHTILISPYVENGNLLKYLQANPTMDCRPLVAQAVAFLHENKRIHGDIKCENVLISDEGKAMLADFGLSTFDSSTVHSRTFTQLRQRMTLPFAAPELVFVTRIQMPDGLETLETKGKSAETDVYAFAMTVIQAFTRRPPWDTYNDMGIMIAMSQKITHPRPQTVDPPVGLCDQWWNLCVECWHYDPSERPSMATILNKLTAAPGESHNATRMYDPES